MALDIKQTYQERILKVLIHIQNHLDHELSLEALAKIAFFSPFHFHRIFTVYTGESIQNYVRRLRLQRATQDLVYTDLTIIQIAERAGYDTQQSFHRAFKEMYHETPKTFREKKLQIITDFNADKNVEKKLLSEGHLVDIKTIDPIQVAFVRHVGSYDDIFKAWLTLTTQISMPTLLSDDTVKISIPYDAPASTPADKLRYDACVVLDTSSPFKPKGQIGVQTLQGGKYAVITHHGPIENIEKTYQILFGLWLPHSGYEPADYPNFILHRTMPFKTPAKSLVTDIYLPLKTTR